MAADVTLQHQRKDMRAGPGIRELRAGCIRPVLSGFLESAAAAGKLYIDPQIPNRLGLASQ